MRDPERPQPFASRESYERTAAVSDIHPSSGISSSPQATGYESVGKDENKQVWNGIRTFLFPTIFDGCAGELLPPFFTCPSIHYSPPILAIVFEIAG